jgi:hypothetical protein
MLDPGLDHLGRCGIDECAEITSRQTVFPTESFVAAG